ncbi:MAG: FtsQ-type POTRA domain-containing protein [Firmicutes bacterium]|uniref:Cell division protein FtsQ n=1 Tax=Melghirimyces thermohalophilus TaxID=1236220 RepID=A0A1G6HRJ7_9BACL|nr:FtsQ-type POTRA domain-containing protein [Melghirimyces thermohalophilus]MDA8354421.1 FtsQ-type POTRA domain-containing protein [Bacillota bacterium]SDB96773.1 cell division protein FtsQ [Melghirimyces thermohalophilus]
MDERVPPLRPSNHGRKPPSVTAIFFILLFFLGIGVVLFLKSPLSEIRNIRIEGNELVSDREVLETIRLVKGTSFFHWDAGQAEEALTTLPEVRDASVTKSFPSAVRVRLNEVERVGYWSRGDRLYPLLSDGSVLREDPWEGEVDRPVIRGLNKGEVLISVAKGLSRLSPGVIDEISEIRPGQDDTYSDLVKVYTRRDHLIHVRARDFGEKVKYYAHFKNRPPGTLNLLESTWYVPGTQHREP